MKNFLFLADSYKISHHLQYPPGTEKIFSYFESRGGKWKSTLFFGLQYILKKHLVGQVVTQEMIDEAQDLFKKHFRSDIFNAAGWEYILKKHGGRLPLEIRAVPEGCLVPTGNVLFTVENTDPEVPWLTNFVETLLVEAWYPLTVATNSYQQKVLLEASLRRTADSLDSLPYMLHDFGYRGVSSVESAGIGGAAHLVNFLGTDTIAGIITARDYYSAEMAGYSVPATEHSTMTTWGRHGEKDAVAHILDQVGEAATVGVVVDSYDVFHMLETIVGDQLKEVVEARSGTLVVRPDSGDPTQVVPKVLDILGEKFGNTRNTKGYKVLPSFIRVLQGDGISYESLQAILLAVEAGGWSTENLIFGSGGALLQRVDRDTQRCAFKCSFMVRNGEEMAVFKDPVTDPGKRSKKGRLVLVKEDGVFRTVTKEEMKQGQEDELLTVFKDGELTKDWKWEEVKEKQGGREEKS